jgi:ribose/xylose/arabinose/galactoside ABC-type transport system permease subunit
VILRKTGLGRNVLAIGNSREAARVAGINIPYTETVTYVLVGLFTALAAIMMTANQGSSNYGVPTGTEFTVISAVVLGGTALAGGKGSILNTVIASLFIATIPTALTTFGVDNNVHGIFNGVILVIAFSINTIRAFSNDFFVRYRARKTQAQRQLPGGTPPAAA